VILARRTQTNEPARCATLLPALAQLSSEEPGVLPGTGGPAPGADPLTLVLARDGHAFSSAIATERGWNGSTARLLLPGIPAGHQWRTLSKAPQ
jgi:hypothetical protein